jgi:hypothetical protein
VADFYGCGDIAKPFPANLRKHSSRRDSFLSAKRYDQMTVTHPSEGVSDSERPNLESEHIPSSATEFALLNQSFSNCLGGIVVAYNGF